VLEDVERKYAARAKVVNGVKEPSDGVLGGDKLGGFQGVCHVQAMFWVTPKEEEKGKEEMS